MKITDITKNPFIKISGIILVIYFALFYNKTNPNSLGNRFSPDNLKNNLREANEKTLFIMSHVNQAQKIDKEKQPKSPIIAKEENEQKE
jgi:hypothetical protein